MLESSVAWIDFAEQDRRRLAEVISLFRHRDTRDELGLGSVRDAFANLFFPGTTTLQTRARYFLFVPWIYRYFEEHRIPSRKIEGRLKNYEIRLIDALTTTEQEGVIGSVSGASLQRFPSSIYWNGLEAWGIRQFPGSQSQYHRWLDRFYEQQRSRSSTEGESFAQGVEPNWDPNLPKTPEGFPSEADLRLTPDEAGYLRERLLISCPDSLLVTLVDQCAPVEDVGFVWQHPQLTLFPQEQQASIDQARNFSEVMHGAVLLYNLMLAELASDHELLATYEQDVADWWEALGARTAGLVHWDRDAFWRLVRGAGQIPIRTQRFVDRWLDVLLSAQDPSTLSHHPPARSLVREREIWLKRGRSRFQSRRHLEMWSGAAGLGRLDYRWPIARDITNDILRGLE
jgi:hypothetical protein